MRTVKDVIERAMVLSGMSGPDGTVDTLQNEDVIRRGMAAAGQIYTDLHYAVYPGKELYGPRRMTDEVDLPERVVNDVMPYGVAMLLCQMEGDDRLQSVFATLYNQKRRSLTTGGRVQDTLPTGEW